MATLADEDRTAVWSDYMSQLSGRQETIELTKSDLREAINAVDDWLDAADSAIYQALPEAAQAALTVSQVRDIFMLVLTKRHDRQV